MLLMISIAFVLIFKHSSNAQTTDNTQPAPTATPTEQPACDANCEAARKRLINLASCDILQQFTPPWEICKQWADNGELASFTVGSDGTITLICVNGATLVWPPATTPTPTPTAVPPTPTPKPPACGTSCTTPADCVGARDSCTSCINTICQQEEPTPTPTPTPPACGTPCNVPADCEGALGCNACLPNAGGTKVCSPVATPTPTPTPVVPACGTSCTTPADCVGARDSCTSCVNNRCQVAPTPTPNPFSQTMCHCDGITLNPTSFVAGQKLTVTSFAKVEGGDTSYATIPNILFTSEHYSDPSHGIRDIPYEVPIATTIVEDTAAKVRYKSIWSYTVPTNPDPNLTYKIRGVPQCVQKTAGIQNTNRIADTEAVNAPLQKNAISQFFDFIVGIFVKKPVTQTSRIQSNSEKSLQLDTLKIGGITGTDYCSYIEFKVK